MRESAGVRRSTSHDTQTHREVHGQPQSNPHPSSPSSKAASSIRYFEFIGGGSRKFWEISLTGNSFTVRFGRIGTAGQSQTKSFADDAKAKREADSLIAEKLKKGYQEARAAGPS